jgi:hypothetical protein
VAARLGVARRLARTLDRNPCAQRVELIGERSRAHVDAHAQDLARERRALRGLKLAKRELLANFQHDDALVGDPAVLEAIARADLEHVRMGPEALPCQLEGGVERTHGAHAAQIDDGRTGDLHRRADVDDNLDGDVELHPIGSRRAGVHGCVRVLRRRRLRSRTCWRFSTKRVRQQRAEVRGGHGEVRRVVDQAAMVDADGFAGFEIDEHRAGVAAERRAIVLDAIAVDAHHAAGREPLLLIDIIAKDLDHQLLIPNAGIARRIPDRPDGRARFDLVGELDGSGKGCAPRLASHPQERDIGLVGRRHPEDRRDRVLGAVETMLLLQEIDVRRDQAADDARPEDERRGASIEPRKHLGDVPVGDENAVGDHPSGAGPGKVAVIELDPANGGNDLIDQILGRGDRRRPGVVGRPEEFGRHLIVADARDRPRARGDRDDPFVGNVIVFPRIELGQLVDGDGNPSSRSRFLGLLDDHRLQLRQQFLRQTRNVRSILLRDPLERLA